MDGTLIIDCPLPRQARRVQAMVMARLKPSAKIGLRITEWRFLGTTTFQRLRMLTTILDLFCFSDVLVDDPKFQATGSDQAEALWISVSSLFEIERAHRIANLRASLKRARDGGGVVLGRPLKLDADRRQLILQLHARGMSQSQIARDPGVRMSRASVWRVLKGERHVTP
jgi:hypothetical protein